MQVYMFNMGIRGGATVIAPPLYAGKLHSALLIQPPRKLHLWVHIIHRALRQDLQ